MRNRIIIFMFLLVFLANTAYSSEKWTPVIPGEKMSPFENKLKEKVSVDYKDAEILNVLRSLAWTHKLNVITSRDVKGKVTVSLKDITVEQALEAILTINGMSYSIRGDIIYVSPGDSEVVELTSEVIFLKYIASADAQNLMREVLSSKGNMKIDEVANSIIMTDYPANIQKVKDLLKKVDVAPKQILIEAKIIDITSSDMKQLGAKWNFKITPGQGLFTDVIQADDLELNVPASSSSLSGGQFVLDNLNFKGLSVSATIDALVSDGKANLLATPSIAVLNGQEARIIIGQRYPITERTQTTTGTTEVTKFVDIGTTLKVIPQINQDNYITMRVHPEVSSLAQDMPAGPRITTREADTTVRIKEGETLIIGGLIKQEDATSKEKIPFLGDIPLIGYLFSTRSDDKEQVELAVFITPRILRSREEKELMGEKAAKEDEVYVNIAKTGELHLVEEIFKKARALNKGYGIESVRKSKHMRKEQAANLYEHIHSQYPSSARAPEALYSAGLIHQKFFKNYNKAGEDFSRLISDYPDSKYAEKAERKYREIEKIKKRKLRKKRK